MFVESAVFWVILGFVLIGIEIFALNMILVFFGVGALVVAVLTGVGLVTSLTLQLLLFAIVSLLVLYSLRRRFQKIFIGGTKRGDEQADDTGLAGRRGTVTREFSDGQGEVELGGTAWKAVSARGHNLEVGEAIRVTGSKGITVTVEPLLPQE